MFRPEVEDGLTLLGWLLQDQAEGGQLIIKAALPLFGRCFIVVGIDAQLTTDQQPDGLSQFFALPVTLQALM